PARRRRSGFARARERIDPRRDDRLRTRAAGAGTRLDRAADRRRMKRRTLVVVALAAAALLVLATAAVADPPAPASPTSSVPVATLPAAPDLTQSTPGPGIQVGPPLPADQGQGG